MVSQSTSVDMSVKVGGRVVQPALPVVDGSFPSPIERSFQKSMEAWTSENIPLESLEGIRRRERVLDKMGAVCREWIKSVCVKKGLPPDVVEAAGGQLSTSGSYRLGVHEPSADIDTILVAPNMCQRNDFFGRLGPSPANKDDTTEIVRDPDSLAERIRRHPDVTNFNPVEGAAVPLLTFDWEGVNIDLLFARLNSNSVPADFDIDNDAVLDGADSATEKSLNGPRVTNLIAALVTGPTPDRYQTFLAVVRCVRKWAKARGLYSNKMGYWGGVNINIAVAVTVQLYPNACPATLLRKFFLVFRTWRWPQPVMLTKPHDAGYGLTVWSAQTAMRQVAPMITPAYPAMNSQLSVSRQTLQILQEEFNRAHEIVDQLWKDHQKSPEKELNWKTLFEPSDFFISYPHYFSFCIVGPTQEDAQAWAGFVESRLRKLVSDMLGRSLPLKKIQLWPKKVEACIADKSALLTQAQRQNSITYFVGFQVDRLRMRGSQLNVELPLKNFREWDLARFQPLVPGMDLLAKVFFVKNLPKVCFEGIYENGKAEAMEKRRKILDADPVRQEKKRLAKLQELKEKMAEIQRKKEDQQNRKRKREGGTDDDNGDNDSVKVENEERTVKEEHEEAVVGDVNPAEETAGDSAATAVLENEETNLLESALDNIVQDGNTGEKGKTREEAQADRQKLLAGELLTAADEEQEGTDEFDEEELQYYTGEENRHSFYGAAAFQKDKQETKQDINTDKRSLPVAEEDANMLKKLGYAVVTDDENKMLGANILPPWRQQEKPDDGYVSNPPRVNIRFLHKFDDLVELDVNGHVIDKGDADFSPSKKWIGRKAGFEFKLGERGLGYYRTGKKVVVPSNTAY